MILLERSAAGCRAGVPGQPQWLVLFPARRCCWHLGEEFFRSLQQLDVGCFKSPHTVGFYQGLCSSWKQFQAEIQAMKLEWSVVTFFFFPFFNFWCDLLDKTVFGKHFSLVFSLLFLPPLLKGEWIDITYCIPTCLCFPWCVAGTFSLAQMVLFLQRWQRFSGCKQVRPQKSGKLEVSK